MKKYVPTLLVLVAGIVATLIAASMVRETENRLTEYQFHHQADMMVDALQGGIDRNVEIFETFAAFYAHNVVSREEFHRFADKLLRHHGDIQAMEWVPRVADAQRVYYEESARREGLPAFHITERRAQGEMVPTENRPEYFPVFFVEPLKGNEAAAGFDLASNPARRQALEASRDAGEMAATGPLRLVQEKGSQTGFLMFQPIYRLDAPLSSIDERRQALRGFALGVFRFGDMADYALRNIPDADAGLSVHDLGAPAGEDLLYRRSAADGGNPTQDEPVASRSSHYRVDLPLRIPGRHWSVHLESSPAFESAHVIRLAGWVLTIGLLLTALFVSYLWNLMARNREQQAHAVVLNEANRLLKMKADERKRAEEALHLADRVFRSTTEGIAVTDADANIVAVNPAFEAITGYSQAEVLGKNPRVLQSGRQDHAFYRDLWTVLLATGQWRGELWNRRKNGGVYPEWLTLSTVKDAQGGTTNYVGVFRDISSIKEAQQEIEFLTHHDALTRLPNRTLLRDRLDQGMQRARRESYSLALLYLGLDHFKHVNETLGHTAGDAVLQEVARRLAGATRAGDTLARLAGDEFVLLVENDVVAQQVVIAKKLLDLFTVPMRIDGQELPVTASIGMSLYPDDGIDADTLLKHADQAMHTAKAEGRNTYRFFDPALSAGALERMHMEKALREALAQNQLLLHYQPQVDLYSGEITGMEALLRWQHPDKGLLAPSDFIPLAEETDLIVPVGAWVLQTACRQLQAWHAAGHAGLRMSINVSALQFSHGALEETVTQALRENGLDGRYLELELNEDLILSDFDKSLAMLRQVKSLGVGLAVDHFGFGHSIKHFPIDKLKIDKSFIAGIVTDIEDASIVQAIIAMGHGLRIRIVAEGVETEAQAGYLRMLHCDEMQGFHCSRALPAEEIPALLAAHATLSTSSKRSGERVLLLVDDEANILFALTRVLRRDGYQILTASSATEGLNLLAQHKVGVVLSDQRMPGMNGTEFLSRVKVLYPHIVRMILSGYTDVNSITESVNRGEIYKFLTKPWEDEPLRETLKEAFIHYESSRDTVQKRE